ADDAGALGDCKERWAYCKLYSVAQALERSTGSSDNNNNNAAMEQEVKKALALAPKLEGFGQKLLIRLKAEAAATAVTVKHTTAKGKGWAMAETANFTVYHSQTKEIAEKVVTIAEQTRTRMLKKWFGESSAKAWRRRCEIYLYATAEEF